MRQASYWALLGLLLLAGLAWKHWTRDPDPCIAYDTAAAAACEKRCEKGEADACDQAGWWWGAWRGGAETPTPPRDREKGRAFWRRACELGRIESCGRTVGAVGSSK